MQRQRSLLCRFLLIFVVAIVQGTGNVEGAVKEPFITYTCTNTKVTGISITADEVAHVKVFNRDGSYCIPSPQTQEGVFNCISTFVKANAVQDVKINVVTIIYEDETETNILGGINTKYYMLSCEEQSANVTVAIAEINFKTTTPVSPTKLGTALTETPSLTVFNHVSTDYYIGEKITLEMKVDAKYKLLPQTCTAYKSDTSTDNPYMFWQRCTNTDNAIIPADKSVWKLSSTQSTLHIDMYAFRFVDSAKLVIKCFTTVCLTKETEMCKMDCPVRKRRSNPEESKNVTSATVSIALEVHDRRQFLENSSQCLSPVWYLYTIAFGMTHWMTWKKL